MSVTAKRDSFIRPDVAVKRTDKKERIKGGICLLAHIFSCSFWRAAFSGNVKANSNLASCPFFTHKPGIFCAHISKVDHEMAACWDNEMHLCPIIPSITCIFPGSCCWKNRQAESSSRTSGNRAMPPGCYLHAWESVQTLQGQKGNEMCLAWSNPITQECLFSKEVPAK